MQNKVSLTTLTGLIVRAAVQAIGGGFVASGTLDGAQTETISGAVLILASLVWSWFQKRQAAKKLASAQA
jgi:hypothetical protein